MVMGAICLTNMVMAQDLFTGKVTDNDDGSPLIGAAVVVKGGSQGVVTDAEGNFALETEMGNTILISYIGFKTAEIELNNTEPIIVSLVNDLVLDELVVVGYGEQQKVNLSGAVDAIDKEILANRPIQSIAQGLQGVSPNLNIDYLSGEPGTAPKFNIRGFTSINEGNPLIIVDGVPTTPEELNSIPPGDVENITVLKDASSAAIYGARAAYGVILITTKMPEKEGITLSYTNNFSWNKPTVLPNKVTDPYIYLRLQETSTDNTPWDNTNYSDQTYQWAKERSENPSLPSVRENPTDPTQWEYMGGKDWTREFLDDATFSQQHNITFGSRGERSNVLLSTSYDDQQGVLDNIATDNYDRYSIRGKVDFDIYDWLKVGNNTTLAFTERVKPSYVPANDQMWEIYNFHPTDWDINPDGTYANTAVGRYKSQLQQGGQNSSQLNIYQTSFNAEMRFFEGALKLNGDYTIRKNVGDVDWYQTKYKVGYGPSDVRELGSSQAWRLSSENTYSVFNVYATYNKVFGDKHQVSGVVGYNQEENLYEEFYSQKFNLISSSLPSIQLATGETFVGEEVREWAVRGYFFRANYIFRDKYIVEFNGRYDGSSKFPNENRWGFFPSASLAWRVDQEPFWSPMENLIDQFKLRASYGSLGNQFVDEYDYLPSMPAGLGSYLIGGSLPITVSSPPLVSRNYTWEEVNSKNVGFDLGMFSSRLTASFDYYSRETLGMLTLGKELPAVLGASEPTENAADLNTKGWELTLGYQNGFNVFGKPMNFNSRLIFSDSQTEITRFDNPNKVLTQFYDGMEIGQIWGLRSDGLFQSEAEIAELDQQDIVPWGAISVTTGWPKYVDLDGNGRIEKGTTVDDPKDLSVIGNLQPRLRYGIDLSMNWNGFDLRMFFQGVAKRDFYPLHYLYWGFYQQPYAGGYEHLLDFYRASDDSDVDRAKHSQAYLNAGLADANTDAKYPHLQAWLADRNLGERIDQAQGLAIPQTRYMLNGAYLRFKNLTVGYTLPRTLTEKIKVANVRVYFSGENLTEWSELKDFYDPEAINDDVAKLDPRRSSSEGWGYAYPLQRRYSLGLNVTF
ncbi:MAG: SusC/RagA family TonB-linked outer membrane protein [Cyclobacteriaceae bacterium]|nr:MAG: SusC/RagA family TonB-linked outer membrane protein [Cyclobacteriaceae bacterium]